MSDIFKKITSIEPVDDDALDALNLTRADEAPRRPLLRPLPEDIAPLPKEMRDDDPVPEFITRDGDRESGRVEAAPAAAPEPKPKPEVKAEPMQASVQEPRPAAEQEHAAPSPIEPRYSAAPAALGLAASATQAPPTGWMKWVGIASVFVWLGASFAYMYGSFGAGQKLTDLTPIQIAGLILAILLPAILLGILFYALRQLAKISAQSHDLVRAAQALSSPDDSVIAKTAIMSKAVKMEIDSVDARIDQALARMNSLESVLKDQTSGLSQASAATSQTADEIASRLSTQRLALENIAGTFDNRMAMLSSTLDEQSSKLEASTQLAEHKIQEARISIDGAAEKINAASDVVRGNTVEAASTLTKSHGEIESLAEMIRARSAELDEVYRKHAQDLTGMIGELRDEQQDMSISLEERLVKMRDMSLSAKVSAESLTEASKAGKETVQALAEATRLTDTAVKQRFAEMEDLVKFSGDKADSISDRAARRVQDSLSQTRKEIARIENDMVALQARLNAPQPAQSLELEIPEQPRPAKRERIRLTPLEEDFPPVEPPRFEAEPKPMRLRPTPESEAVFKPAPPLSPAPIAAPQSIPRPDEQALDLLEELTLEVEPLDLTENMTPIDPDAEIKAFSPEDLIAPSHEPLRPAAPPTSEEIVSFGKKKKKDAKEKSGWRWRDMLGGLDRPDDIVRQDDGFMPLSPAQPREVSDQRMLASLAALGLTPAAVVDDGCIIEAANTRKTKGSIAMSQAVARRMGDPVRHLHRAIEENPALKTDARTYTAQFQARMMAIENDREAIRTKFESDAGRAYLLCDAALNG
ncbi:MAG: hypothetical protein ABJN69_17445 [Hellea sp.]